MSNSTTVPNVPMKGMGKKMMGSSVTGMGTKKLGGAGMGSTFPNAMKGGKKPAGTTSPNIAIKV